MYQKQRNIDVISTFMKSSFRSFISMKIHACALILHVTKILQKLSNAYLGGRQFNLYTWRSYKDYYA